MKKPTCSALLKALENIQEVIEGAKRVRELSFIESAILVEGKKGLKKY